MSRADLKIYIDSIQKEVQSKLSDGMSIDDYLDSTDIFDEFESILPDAEFSIFAIAILHNIKKDGVIEPILDAIMTSSPSNDS